MQRANIPLLQLASGLLQPSQTFGGALGNGLQGFSHGLMADQKMQHDRDDQELKKERFELMKRSYEAELANAQATAESRAKANQLITGLQPEYQTAPDDPLAGPINSGLTRRAQNPEAVRNAQLGLLALGDERGASLGGLFAKPKADYKVVNGKVVRIDDDGVSEAFDAGPSYSEQLSAANSAFLPDGSPNPAYQQFKENTARAGATTVNNVMPADKKLYEGIGSSMGKSIDASREAALGAVDTINTVDQIAAALDSGKVIAGPTAKTRTYLAQIGQMMGVGGKDTTETLQNTRKAIQGLAQLELDAAKQMKGQGQITEAERAIIRRAAAGNVEDMTTTELRELIGIQRKLAARRIAAHNQIVSSISKDPEVGNMGQLLSVPEPAGSPQRIQHPAQAAQPALPPNASDEEILRFYSQQ